MVKYTAKYHYNYIIPHNITKDTKCDGDEHNAPLSLHCHCSSLDN